MSIHDIDWHQSAKTVRPRSVVQVRVIKAAEAAERRSRAELTLLYELIQRNPERAKEFLERLRQSIQQEAA